MRIIIKTSIQTVSLFVFLAFFGFLMSCSEKQTETTHVESEAEHAHEGEEHAEEIVPLTEAEMNEFGIRVATAGPGPFKQYVDLTGEIGIDPARLAHIYPRFPGIVQDVRKKIGDTVQKGEVLAIIESNESLAPYEIRSLIDGEVIDMHLTLGEVVSDDSHAFKVADLSKVWVNLNIYQKNLPDIRLGQHVTIFAPPDSFSATGKISYISPTVSEQTRTATARVVLNNTNGKWRPGLFVNARVVVHSEEANLLVPQSAVTTFEERDVVFIRHEDVFEPQPVTIGRRNSDQVEIVAGLQPGQVYVTQGAFTLKSELQKKTFGGHNH